MMTIEINKKDLVKAIRHLKAVLPKDKNRAVKVMCDLKVSLNEVSFSVPGAVFPLKAKNQDQFSTSFPFLYFMDVVKTTKEESIKINISERAINIQNSTISAKTTFFKKEKEVFRGITLPVNYTDLDLLRLREKGYNGIELEYNKLTEGINQAERKLEKNISYVYSRLKIYGVTREEVKELVESKIYRDSKLQNRGPSFSN